MCEKFVNGSVLIVLGSSLIQLTDKDVSMPFLGTSVILQGNVQVVIR